MDRLNHSQPNHSQPNSPYNPGTPSSVASSQGAGPRQPRQRLRPWLIDQINSAEIEGLEWVDKEALSFKIPWKHFGRPGIDEYKDALLFRRWALHTKKFKEGEVPDISTWKTRFRCALHKLPDIEELHNCNQKDGDEPYRVYRFIKKEIEVETLPCGVTSPKREEKPYIGNENNGIQTNGNPVWMSPESTHELDFPNNGTHDELMFDELGNLPMDPSLDGIQIEDILHGNEQNNYYANNNYNPTAGNNTTNNNPSTNTNVASNGTAPHSSNVSLNAIQTLSNLHPQQAQYLSSVEVKLYFGEKEVDSKIVDNPSGLRIAFNPPPALPHDVVQDDTAQFVSHIFGPFQADQIYFPQTEDMRTRSILECIRRGLVLQSRNGQILATRLCRAKIFYSDSVVLCEKELPREHTVVIFDYVNDFYPKLRAFMTGQGPSPTFERYFSFAQKWSHSSPLINNYVRVSVSHCLAQKQLTEFQNAKPELLISDPNMLDYIAQQIDGLNLDQNN